MRADAVVSTCGQYRYRLTRKWDERLTSVVFMMLNPSTADATQDDPTIRRCIGYARDWGFGGIAVVNLYAFRATKPADMLAAADPVGPENDRHLTKMFAYARETDSCVVAAWGANARPDRVAEVVALAHSTGADLAALGVTKDGAPRHPLYMPKAATPQVWEAAS